MTVPGRRTHYRHCHLCEAMCGIAIELHGDRITAIRGDDDDPFSQGHVCPKAVAIADIHDDPDRLRRPVVREGKRGDPDARWREVSWDEALDRAARGFIEVRRSYGRDAVATYAGNPAAHNAGAILFGLPLILGLGTRHRYSALSVDVLPRLVASWFAFGNQALIPIPDIDRTSFLLILGANPAVSNGSVMTAPGASRRIRAIRDRGGRVVVIDPRRTETAALADRHHFIRPGADALLLLGILHVIVDEGLARPGRLAAFTTGTDEVRRLALRFPPARVAEATGIDAAAIATLARDFARAPTAVCYGRVGTCNQENGTVASWLIDVLHVLTGNLDRAGGAMFPTPPIDPVPAAARFGQAGSLGSFHSRVRGLPEFGGELPAAAMAEELESDLPGRPRALLTVAGNPVLSLPNGARLERALGRLDHFVAVDIYRNETTRWADVILPPMSPLHQDAYPLAMSTLAVRHVARFAPPAITPPPDGKGDWEILLELATRLGTGRLPGGRMLGRALAWAGRKLGPRGLIDLGLRTGPHRGLSVRRLLRAPHGLDLGPLQPRLPRALATPGRRVRLAPAACLDEVRRLEASLDAGEVSRRAGELVLVSRRQLRSNNSWMHNSRRLVKGPERCTLLICDEDATARGIADGDRVVIRSRTGEVEAPAAVSVEMMPGVVCLPHGWGHGRPGTDLSVASERPGVSVNDVTDDGFVDTISGNAALSGVPVTVEPAVVATMEPTAASARA